MKKLLIISGVLFAGSLVMHFAKVPGHSLVILISILLLLIHNTIYLIKNIRTKPDRVIAFLTITSFSFYLFTRIYFWASAHTAFIISMLLLLLWLGLHIFKKSSFSALQIVLISLFVLVFATSFINADRVYYLFNARYLKEQTASANYELWDRYSWFLYLAGKFDEAEAANETAMKGVQELLEKDETVDAWIECEKQLWQRHEKIRTRTWDKYYDLPVLYY